MQAWTHAHLCQQKRPEHLTLDCCPPHQLILPLQKLNLQSAAEVQPLSQLSSTMGVTNMNSPSLLTVLRKEPL